MRASRRCGLTLIETITAIVILALAIPPMLWAVREAHVRRVNPAMASKAWWLAAEKLEDVIADRHSSTRGYAYLIPANYPAEPTIAGFPGFSRSVQLTETGPDLSAPGAGYMTVAVTVQWTDGGGAARSASISTVVTDYEP